MLSEWARNYSKRIRGAAALVFGRLGFSPNGLTVLGLVLNLPVAYVLAVGHLRLGGILMVLASAFDSLDGALARETDQGTVFGAFLDSVADRLSEAIVLLGLFLFYLPRGARQELILIYATLLGSLMVSYTRARAEGVGVECKSGWFTRFERVVLLAVGLVAQQMRIVLWVLAVLTNFTVVQRVLHVWRATHEGHGGSHGLQGGGGTSQRD